jgi:GT2 family glycosyltransferase
MTISIIIPNYNGAALLKKNLPAIYHAASQYKKASGHDFEIIISDDASSDDSVAVIKAFNQSVNIIENRTNSGFSKNVMRGVQKATGEILILLNTDVSPHEDFLLPLLAPFTDEKVFAVGCLDLSVEHGKEKKRGRGIGRWENGFLLHSAGDVSLPETLWASGGSSAFRKSIWDKLGGLYDVYNPFYWEDIDLSYRAWKSGYLVLFEPKSIVKHEHDSGAIKTQFSKRSVTTTSYRNQFLFVWINITDSSLLTSHIARLPLHLLQALLRGDTALLLGFFKALAVLPEALRLRRKNKRRFTITDTHILGRFSS